MHKKSPAWPLQAGQGDSYFSMRKAKVWFRLVSLVLARREHTLPASEPEPAFPFQDRLAVPSAADHGSYY